MQVAVRRPFFMDLNALVQALAQQAQTSQQNAKTFSDMLRDRRAFVQSAENQSADAASQALQNGGVGGVRISSTDATSPLFNFHTDNANKTAELTQDAFGYQGQANDLLKSIADVMAQQRGQDIQQQQLNLQKQQLGLQYGVDLGGNSGGTSPTSVLDLHAKNIMNGTETLDDVPADLKPRVAQRLTQLGYDPARTVKSLVNQAESEYLGKNHGDTGNSLSFGNNPLRAGASGLGDLLATLSGGALQTGYEKQKNSYETIRKNFQSEIAKLSGGSKMSPKIIDQLSNGLPNESDPPDVAAKKFAFVRDQINNIFYNGSQPDQTGGTGNTLRVGKYTVQY